MKAQGLGKFHKHNNDTAKFTWNPPNHTIIASIHINPDLVSAFPFSPAIANPLNQKFRPRKLCSLTEHPLSTAINPEQIQNAHRMHLDWLRICTNPPCHTSIHRRPNPILAPAYFISLCLQPQVKKKKSPRPRLGSSAPASPTASAAPTLTKQLQDLASSFCAKLFHMLHHTDFRRINFRMEMEAEEEDYYCCTINSHNLRFFATKYACIVCLIACPQE